MTKHISPNEFTIGQFRNRPTGFRFAPQKWFALAKQRRALRMLDQDQLRDIGISKQDALSEAQKPAWDVPGHWQK